VVLNARSEILLRTLIERYIADGQPVGSRSLARHAGLDLSPATVRNVMADLEEMGLVVSPHTSAGRVPTQKGYRIFVDSLLKVRPLDSNSVRRLQDELATAHDPQHLVSAASQMLSEVSKLAGIVMVPRREEYATFRHLDFVSLSAKRVLVILVTEDGTVQNCLIQTEREYRPAELVEAANCFNDLYAGLMLSDVRRRIVGDMQRESDDMQRIMRLALSMANQALATDPDEGDTVVVRGESNLMGFPDLGDVSKLRRLFDAFNTKRDLLHLLDASMRAGGIKIFIGAESGYEAFEDCSLVTAPYSADGHVVGTLGVIGPTRIPYEKVIPIVDITSRLLSAALSLRGSSTEQLESPP